jgi:hypothetical protein
VTTTNLTPLAQQNNNSAGDYQETSASSSSSRHPAALMNMVNMEPVWILVVRIHEILGTDPDPRIQTSDLWIQILLFSSFDLQDVNKKNFLLIFLKVHLHHFLKIISHK